MALLDLPVELRAVLRGMAGVVDRGRLRLTCKQMLTEDTTLDTDTRSYSPIYSCGLWPRKHPIFCALIRAGFDELVRQHYSWHEFQPHVETYADTYRPWGEIVFKYRINLRPRSTNMPNQLLVITCTPAPAYVVLDVVFCQAWTYDQHGHTKAPVTRRTIHDMMRFLRALFYYNLFSCHVCARNSLEEHGFRFLEPTEPDCRILSTDVDQLVCCLFYCK